VQQQLRWGGGGTCHSSTSRAGFSSGAKLRKCASRVILHTAVEKERRWGRAAPRGLVVVETEAKKEERQGEECEAGPSEEGARDQTSHAGNRGWGGRGCCSGVMRRVLRCRCRFFVLLPLLQQPHNLPDCAHANNCHALLLAEHSDANARPSGEHAGPAGARGGSGGQEEEQSEKEEQGWGGRGVGGGG